MYNNLAVSQQARGILVARLKGAVVVSCQAGPESPLNQPVTIAALAQSAAAGGGQRTQQLSLRTVPERISEGGGCRAPSHEEPVTRPAEATGAAAAAGVTGAALGFLNMTLPC